jgi:hypothetical protein
VTAHALFVTWDSPDTTYLESLFLPLFAAMRAHGARVDVLQLTWGDAIPRRAAAAERAGVAYRGIRAPRGGALGMAWALARGPSQIRAELRRSGATILYPRSLLPLALALRARRAEKLVFDADGLVADERVEFARWSPNGPAARWYRAVERRGVREASRVITRTERAKAILLARAGVPGDRVVVVGNAKDESVFTPGTAASRLAFRRAHGIPPEVPWAVYCGSLGPQYRLPEMLAFHRMARAISPEARLTLLTRAPVDVRAPGVAVCAPPTDEIPQWLAAADLGLSWRTPSFSMAGVSPIKVAEYLLCGLPVLGNTGIGDQDALLGPPACRLLSALGPADLEAGARWWLDEVVPARDASRIAARRLGEHAFRLEAAAAATAAVIGGVARC